MQYYPLSGPFSTIGTDYLDLEFSSAVNEKRWQVSAEITPGARAKRAENSGNPCKYLYPLIEVSPLNDP